MYTGLPGYNWAAFMCPTSIYLVGCLKYKENSGQLHPSLLEKADKFGLIGVIIVPLVQLEAYCMVVSTMYLIQIIHRRA